MLTKLDKSLRERLWNVHHDKYIYDQTYWIRKGEKFNVVCRIHGLFSTDYQRSITHQLGCRECENEARIEKYLNIFQKRHGNKYDYSKSDLSKSVSDRISIICKLHGEFEQTLGSHACGHGCKQCADSELLSNTDEFKIKANKIFNGKYDYSKTQYVNADTKVTITCPRHGDFTQRASSHLCGNGCMQCFIMDKNRSNTVEFIKKARKVHGDRFDYSEVNYVTNRTPVKIKCKRHGWFLKIPLSHLHGSGCPRCIASKGEVMISTALKKLNIQHTQEYKINPHKYRYDFHLTGTNILLEYHGKQHYHPVKRFGGLGALEDVKKRDAIKVQLAIDNGFDLITLNYKHMNSKKLINKLIRELKKRNVIS